SSGGGGTLDYGVYIHSCPNWNPQGDTYNTHMFVNSSDDKTDAGINFGYENPMPPYHWNIISNEVYGADVATSRVTGNYYAFYDASSQLQIRKAAAGYCDVIFNWTSGVPSFTIDSRPSNVSRTRSCDSAADDSLHIAYRSADGSSLRYGNNAS